MQNRNNAEYQKPWAWNIQIIQLSGSLKQFSQLQVLFNFIIVR